RAAGPPPPPPADRKPSGSATVEATCSTGPAVLADPAHLEVERLPRGDRKVALAPRASAAGDAAFAAVAADRDDVDQSDPRRHRERLLASAEAKSVGRRL